MDKNSKEKQKSTHARAMPDKTGTSVFERILCWAPSSDFGEFVVVVVPGIIISVLALIAASIPMFLLVALIEPTSLSLSFVAELFMKAVASVVTFAGMVFLPCLWKFFFHFFRRKMEARAVAKVQTDHRTFMEEAASGEAKDKTQELFEWCTSLIPRKHRVEIYCDLQDDILEYRAKGWSERRIKKHIIWQMLVILLFFAKSGIIKLFIAVLFIDKIRLFFGK